ncbi:unnamed protein product, partial [Polarella glacialis]
FLQSRPVGHKSRRMVFVDYDTIECATKGMLAHQGFKWEDVDEGLKIDYDKDARSKRNTAMDEGISEKFFSVGPRKAKVESESDMFARMKAETSSGLSGGAKKSQVPKAKVQPKAKAVVGAKLQVKGKASAVATESQDQAEGLSSRAPALGLVGYSSSEDEAEPASKRPKI